MFSLVDSSYSGDLTPTASSTSSSTFSLSPTTTAVEQQQQEQQQQQPQKLQQQQLPRILPINLLDTSTSTLASTSAKTATTATTADCVNCPASDTNITAHCDTSDSPSDQIAHLLLAGTFASATISAAAATLTAPGNHKLSKIDMKLPLVHQQQQQKQQKQHHYQQQQQQQQQQHYEQQQQQQQQQYHSNRHLQPLTPPPYQPIDMHSALDILLPTDMSASSNIRSLSEGLPHPLPHHHHHLHPPPPPPPPIESPTSAKRVRAAQMLEAIQPTLEASLLQRERSGTTATSLASSYSTDALREVRKQRSDTMLESILPALTGGFGDRLRHDTRHQQQQQQHQHHHHQYQNGIRQPRVVSQPPPSQQQQQQQQQQQPHFRQRSSQLAIEQQQSQSQSPAMLHLTELLRELKAEREVVQHCSNNSGSNSADGSYSVPPPDAVSNDENSYHNNNRSLSTECVSVNAEQCSSSSPILAPVNPEREREFKRLVEQLHAKRLAAQSSTSSVAAEPILSATASTANTTNTANTANNNNSSMNASLAVSPGPAVDSYTPSSIHTQPPASAILQDSMYAAAGANSDGSGASQLYPTTATAATAAQFVPGFIPTVPLMTNTLHHIQSQSLIPGNLFLDPSALPFGINASEKAIRSAVAAAAAAAAASLAESTGDGEANMDKTSQSSAAAAMAVAATAGVLSPRASPAQAMFLSLGNGHGEFPNLVPVSIPGSGLGSRVASTRISPSSSHNGESPSSSVLGTYAPSTYTNGSVGQRGRVYSIDSQSSTDEQREAARARMIDVGLTSQIVKLYNERLLPSRESTERRRKFVDKLEGIIKSEWPDHDIQLHLFGSSANGLATTQSDVDICLTTTWKQLEDLSLLSAVLRRSGMRSIHTVPRAKVPLVKFVDPEYRLSCDINVNNPLAIENTRMIRTFVEIDERVRPLAMIVKFWSKRRDLSDAAFGGTFAPYTWLNLLLNFLQMRDPPILPILHQYRSPLDHGMIPVDAVRDPSAVPPSAIIVDRISKSQSSKVCEKVYLDAWFNDDIEALRGYGKSNTESLGRLLYEFFKTYGVSFDHMTKVVSLRNGCWLDKSDKGWNVGRSAAQVCVEEPFDTTRNLGNSADSESVLGIIGELERAYLVLHETGNLNTVCDKYVDSSLGVYSDIDMIANGPALTLRRGSGGARRASASPNGHVPPRIQTNGASHPGTNGRITGQKVNLSRSVGHLTPPHGRSINAAMMSRSPPGWVGTTAITATNHYTQQQQGRSYGNGRAAGQTNGNAQQQQQQQQQTMIDPVTGQSYAMIAPPGIQSLSAFGGTVPVARLFWQPAVHQSPQQQQQQMMTSDQLASFTRQTSAPGYFVTLAPQPVYAMQQPYQQQQQQQQTRTAVSPLGMINTTAPSISTTSTSPLPTSSTNPNHSASSAAITNEQQNEQQATPVPTTVPTVQSPHPSKPIGYGSASDVIKQPPRLTDIQNELDRASGSSSNGRRSQNRHSRRSSGKRHSRTSSNSNR